MVSDWAKPLSTPSAPESWSLDAAEPAEKAAIGAMGGALLTGWCAAMVMGRCGSEGSTVAGCVRWFGSRASNPCASFLILRNLLIKFRNYDLRRDLTGRWAADFADLS